MLIQFNEISVSISNIQHSHFPRILLAYEIQEISVKAFVLLLQNYYKVWLQWVWDLRRLTSVIFVWRKMWN